MTKDNGLSVYNWPGGITVMAGGTRTAVKIDRIWQKALDIDPDNCPFEPGRLEANHEINLRSEDGGWVAFKNLYTPNQFHRVVVPTTCKDWPEERVRLLGGREEISKAVYLTHQALSLNPVKQKQEHIITHNGYSAGQNVPHIHWHAVVFPKKAQGKNPYDIADQLQIDTGYCGGSVLFKGNLRAVIGGHRAGQCFILPNNQELVSLDNIIDILTPLVELYANKFRSRVGDRLPPDFTIDLVFQEGAFAYGTYVPILNNMGSTEYTGMLGQQAMTLPWPHELTAAYLRGEIELK